MKFGITKKEKNFSPEIVSFRNDVDRLFNDFFNLRSTGFFNAEWVPAVDVYSDEKNIYIKADVAGLEEKDLNVTLQEGILTISGQRVDEKKETKSKNSIITERRYGSFSRSISVPDGISEKDIKAELKNGVLTVTFKRTEEIETKKIKINAN